MRDQGVLPKVADTTSVDPFEPILSRYNCHLRNVRGLTETSRSIYLRYARRLLNWLYDRHPDRSLTELTGVDILKFVTELAPLHPSGSWRQNLCSLTRVFLRYLRWEGILKVDLDRVVPKLPSWRLSSIPRHISWDQVRELIESVDTSRRGRLRDKAVLLLLATLGLRSQEVSRLRLDDMVWRAGEIHLAPSKTRRERNDRHFYLTHRAGAGLDACHETSPAAFTYQRRAV